MSRKERVSLIGPLSVRSFAFSSQVFLHMYIHENVDDLKDISRDAERRVVRRAALGRYA